MLMLRIRTTSVESPVLFLHLAACFAERGDLLSAAYDKRQSSIYGRYLSLVSGYLLSNIIFLERAVIGQNGGRHSSTSDLRTWHIIVVPGYIDTVNRLIDEFIVRLTWHQHLPPVAPSIALTEPPWPRPTCRWQAPSCVPTYPPPGNA